MKKCAITLMMLVMLGDLGRALGDQKRPDDSLLTLFGNIFTFPLQVTYTLFSPIGGEDISTAYRRAGFSEKDQNYFQLNWYGEQRLGYSNLFERKELEEEISREGFGDFRG